MASRTVIRHQHHHQGLDPFGLGRSLPPGQIWPRRQVHMYRQQQQLKVKAKLSVTPTGQDRTGMTLTRTSIHLSPKVNVLCTCIFLSYTRSG